MSKKPNPTTGVAPLLAAFAAFLIATGVAVADDRTGSTPPDPTGEWLVDKKIARIKIVDCDTRLWGVVSWEAQPGVDNKNPDPALRSRPTLGMPVLLGMARSKPNVWEGQIYNSQDGRTYSANISMLDPNTLRVQGCVLGFLCGGEKWTRVDPATLTDSTQTKPPPAGRNAAPAPPGSRRPANSAQTNSAAPADDVCLRLFGAARLPHERGLK